MEVSPHQLRFSRQFIREFLIRHLDSSSAQPTTRQRLLQQSLCRGLSAGQTSAQQFSEEVKIQKS